VFDARRAVWLIALAGAVACSAWPALARDRPGTPWGVYATVCPDRVSPNNSPPSICVQFLNTATEEVTFAAEWTIDGEVQGEPVGSRLSVNCLEELRLVALECHAANSMNEFHMPPAKASLRKPQGIRFSGVAYGVQYCFRFKAVDEDGVISEEWSQNVCVQTPPQPPLPPAPTNVHATVLPAESGIGVPGPGQPPRLLIEWDADDATVGWYLVQRFDRGWSPQREPERGQIKPPLNTAHEETIATTAQDVAAHPFGVQFRVCAENFTGETCSTPASTSNWTGTVERPNPDATGMMQPRSPLGEPRRPGADVIAPPSDAGQVGRPRGGFGTEMSVSAHGPPCKPGFVWRKARAEDFVCATPSASGQVAQENAQAASHVDPAGAYGPNSCAAGYVWREAYRDDIVCVTPQARSMARQENAEGLSHRADAGPESRDPH